MTLLNAYPAVSVGSNFAEWTSTVPLSVLSDQSACTLMSGGGNVVSGFVVSAQLLVPGATGLSSYVLIQDAGCVPATATVVGACATATASVGTSYLVDAGQLLITGTVDARACAVSDLVVMGTVNAVAVAPNFALWSATVPLSITTPGSCATAPGQSSVAVPLELIVPGQDGLPAVQVLDSECAAFELLPEAGALQDAGGQ
jgi:hypothetical protein